MERDQNGENVLRDLADGDLRVLSAVIRDPARGRKASGLDDATFQLLEIVALAAVDAPPSSWYVHFGNAPILDVDKVVAALVAVAPIVGTPKVVSAAENILNATDFVDELETERP
jgi:hypothetical protein